jgi:hypothetical protein
MPGSYNSAEDYAYVAYVDVVPTAHRRICSCVIQSPAGGPRLRASCMWYDQSVYDIGDMHNV